MTLASDFLGLLVASETLLVMDAQCSCLERCDCRDEAMGLVRTAVEKVRATLDLPPFPQHHDPRAPRCDNCPHGTGDHPLLDDGLTHGACSYPGCGCSFYTAEEF